MTTFTLWNIKRDVKALSGLLVVSLAVFYLLSGCALADSFDVTATVPAPLPSQPAIITSHYDQQHVTAAETEVGGTCSGDTAYVNLYRNETFVGATLCNAGGFAIQIVFLPGANRLQARAMSSTAGEGPVVPAITVWYDILQSPQPQASAPRPDLFGPSNTSLSLPSLSPTPHQTRPPQVTPGFFFITTDQSYDARKPGERLEWPITAHGGTPPYSINVDWGDGKTDLVEFRENNFMLEHVYTDAGHYLIKIEATDAANRKANLQLIAVIKGDSAHIQPPPAGVCEPWQSRTWMWPLAITLALIAAIAYLLKHRRRQT